MITFTRQLARQAYDVLRRALAKQNRSQPLAVVIQTARDGLRIRSWTAQAAVQYCQHWQFEADEIRLPLEALKACAGTRPEPVTLERVADEKIVLRWNDQGIPQIAQWDIPELTGEFPLLPEPLQPTRDGFLAALRNAIDTTDKESIRFAMDCICLSGATGSIQATDGRQALIQSGFNFGWSDDVLVPANPVFNSCVFRADSEVQLGRTENGVAFALGPWLIFLPIERERRFPEIASCRPNRSAATTRLRLSPIDAQFLEKSLARLPSDEFRPGLVTLDMNGAVAVRARSQGLWVATELVLSNSARTGRELCLCTDRRFLERALRLGFRELEFVSAQAPAVCCDDCRTYVWALLDQSGIVEPDQNALRISSPPEKERPVPLTGYAKTGRGSRRSPGDHQSQQKPLRRAPGQKKPVNCSSIAQLRQLQTTLRRDLDQARVLLKALRAERKHWQTAVQPAPHGNDRN